MAVIENLLQYSFGLLVLYWLFANPDRREKAKDIFMNTVKRIEGKQ